MNYWEGFLQRTVSFPYDVMNILIHLMVKFVAINLIDFIWFLPQSFYFCSLHKPLIDAAEVSFSVPHPLGIDS